MPIRQDLFCSFVFIYDEEVTIKKENLYWDILQPLRHVYGLVFAFSRSSVMSICSSLVALMALSFSPPLMKIVCFLFNWLLSVSV